MRKLIFGLLGALTGFLLSVYVAGNWDLSSWSIYGRGFSALAIVWLATMSAGLLSEL